MKPAAILLPCAAMVLVTLVVWVKLYLDQLREMRRRTIDPQDLATTRQAQAALEQTGAADNFRNLFELPVLFYVLCLALFMTGAGHPGFVYAGWAFVALRAVHSFIHCTYNQVIHRSRRTYYRV